MVFGRTRAPEGPRPSSGVSAGPLPTEGSDSLGHLQRALGNLSLRRLVTAASPLTVGRPGDASERQADDLAARAAEATSSAVAPSATTQSAAGTRAPRSSAAHALIARLGDGQALARDDRASLEARLGGDLSRARIHTGPEAHAAAARLRARAFAVGEHVAFGAGEYQPGSREGRRLLGHELAHTLQTGSGPTPDVQRTPIPGGAPLADFVGLTQQAIDGIRPAGALTVGPEVVMLLRGLRGHISLRDAAGRLSLSGGAFVLNQSNTVAALGQPMNFQLVVDDTTTPSLGARFSDQRGTGEILVEAAHFRGSDTASLGQALFHEMVHALLFLHRARPTLALRPDVMRALDPSRHDHFVPVLQRHLDHLFPGDARNARAAAGLIEEIVAIVETEVHQAWEDGQPGIPMPHDEFVTAIRAHLFGAGLFYTSAEGVTVAAQAGGQLSDLLELLFRYYLGWSHRRRFETAIIGEGLRIDATRPSISTEREPEHRSFIPDIIRSADEIP
jgi:hypothetical protein